MLVGKELVLVDERKISMGTTLIVVSKRLIPARKGMIIVEV